MSDFDKMPIGERIHRIVEYNAANDRSKKRLLPRDIALQEKAELTKQPEPVQEKPHEVSEQELWSRRARANAFHAVVGLAIESASAYREMDLPTDISVNIPREAVETHKTGFLRRKEISNFYMADEYHRAWRLIDRMDYVGGYTPRSTSTDEKAWDPHYATTGVGLFEDGRLFKYVGRREEPKKSSRFLIDGYFEPEDLALFGVVHHGYPADEEERIINLWGRHLMRPVTHRDGQNEAINYHELKPTKVTYGIKPRTADWGPWDRTFPVRGPYDY